MKLKSSIVGIVCLIIVFGIIALAMIMSERSVPGKAAAGPATTGSESASPEAETTPPEAETTPPEAETTSPDAEKPVTPNG